jgi:hypothetical protein
MQPQEGLMDEFDALAQLEGHLTPGNQEAIRLIQDFHQSLIKAR